MSNHVEDAYIDYLEGLDEGEVAVPFDEWVGEYEGGYIDFVCDGMGDR